MDRKEDKIKIKFMSGPLSPMSSMGGDGADCVHIEKIDNGFVVNSCGMGKRERKYVKKLAMTPTLIARMMGIKGKNSKQISESVEMEDDD